MTPLIKQQNKKKPIQIGWQKIYPRNCSEIFYLYNVINKWNKFGVIFVNCLPLDWISSCLRWIVYIFRSILPFLSIPASISQKMYFFTHFWLRNRRNIFDTFVFFSLCDKSTQMLSFYLYEGNHVVFARMLYSACSSIHTFVNICKESIRRDSRISESNGIIRKYYFI